MIHLEQRFLGKILGPLAIAGVAKEEADQRGLILPDDLLERGSVPLLKANHQMIVFSQRKSPEFKGFGRWFAACGIGGGIPDMVVHSAREWYE